MPFTDHWTDVARSWRLRVLTRHRCALVVTPRAHVSQPLTRSLARFAYSSLVVREFAAARQEMQVDPPDLLVSEVRLGAYNGLHLAVHARSRGWKIPVVLLGDDDRNLRIEADRLQCAYLVPPFDEQALLTALPDLQPAYRPLRRAARKRVTPLDALMNDLPARIVDVSYEGLRLELFRAAKDAVPTHFLLQVPSFNVSCRAQRMWMSVTTDASTSCGASLDDNDVAALAEWRAVVDSVPADSQPALG